MYKLICIDLDGTLLDSHTLENKYMVSEVNKKAILDALDAGIQVAIVSGRPNCFTTRIRSQISDQLGHITFNGAYYRVGNKTQTFPIDTTATKRLANIVKENQMGAYFKNKNLSLYTKADNGILDYDNYKAETPLKDQMDMRYHVDVDAYLQTKEMEVLKIMVLNEEESVFQKVSKEIMADTSGLRVFQYPDFLEMSSIHTSKGNAVVNVCKELDIDMKDVVCIGDNYNDIPMFKVAGLSVAMGNAVTEIQELCDVVTKTNKEGGVAHAIYEYVLNK